MNFIKTWELHRGANAATPNFIHTKWMRTKGKIDRMRWIALRFTHFSLTFAALTIWSLSSFTHNIFTVWKSVPAQNDTSNLFSFHISQQKMQFLFFVFAHYNSCSLVAGTLDLTCSSPLIRLNIINDEKQQMISVSFELPFHVNNKQQTLQPTISRW